MIKFSPQRIYYFLFFNAAYAFLSFWISLVYFARGSDPKVANGFLIGGVLFYLFLIIFHKAIISITTKNQAQFDEIIRDRRIVRFYIFLIVFCGVQLVSVYLLQEFLIRGNYVPSEIFAKVGIVLNLFSFIISFLLSFFEKKQRP